MHNTPDTDPAPAAFACDHCGDVHDPAEGHEPADCANGTSHCQATADQCGTCRLPGTGWYRPTTDWAAA